MSTPRPLGEPKEKLAFFLPAYNEAGTIYRTGAETVHALGAIGSNNVLSYKLIIVNDGSTDATGEQAHQLAADFPGQVSVVSHDTNRGYGAAVRTGLREGLQRGHALIGYMDGDGQFDASELEKLLHTMSTENVAAVIGVRRPRHDTVRRRLIGTAWNTLSDTVLNHGMADVDCGFKLFRHSLLEVIEPQLISSVGAVISPEIVSRAKQAGFRVSQVDLTHGPRLTGQSTGLKPNVIKHSLKDLRRVRADIQHASPETSRRYQS